MIGATYLRMRGFAERVPHLIEGHVLAKRYLCFAEPGYHDKLSPAVQQGLRRVDVVCLKGSSIPMAIYTCDRSNALWVAQKAIEKYGALEDGKPKLAKAKAAAKSPAKAAAKSPARPSKSPRRH